MVFIGSGDDLDRVHIEDAENGTMGYYLLLII